MREDRQAQMLNNFHLYAVKDPVDMSDLSEELPSLRAFEELKFQDILPSCNDRDEILESYVTLFARIVTAEIPFFKQFQDVVPLHIAHQHSREMERKSEVVSSYLNWIYTPWMKFVQRMRLMEIKVCYIHFTGAFGGSVQVWAKAWRYALHHGKHPAVFSIHYGTTSCTCWHWWRWRGWDCGQGWVLPSPLWWWSAHSRAITFL